MPFKKGDPNINRKGAPKGVNRVIHLAELREALSVVEKEKKETFLVMICRTAWDNPSVALSLLRKFVPDAEPTKESDESLINQELVFSSIPSNGDGLSRFQQFIHK
jgi:hypothetical protein